MKDRIESLQVLRAIAFLGIFLAHAGFKYSWSNIGVSIFFIMSGFLMMYSYWERNVDCSITQNIIFSIRKIKKLYFLHIITMSFFMFFEIFRYFYKGVLTSDLILKLILNITLLQAWYPTIKISNSLNGVAWFLSVTMFLYFLFPYILRFLKNNYKDIKLLCFYAFIAWLYQLLTPYFLVKSGIMEYDSSLESCFIHFTYICPLYRLSDFFIDTILGVIYLNYKEYFKNFNLLSATIIETLFIIFLCLFYKLYRMQKTSILFKTIFNPTVPWFLLSFVAVFLFIVNKSLIVKHLCKIKSLIWLGDISPYAFLIHYVLTSLSASILSYYKIQFFNDGYGLCIKIILLLLLTLIISYIYKKYENKLWYWKGHKYNVR